MKSMAQMLPRNTGPTRYGPGFPGWDVQSQSMLPSPNAVSLESLTRSSSGHTTQSGLSSPRSPRMERLRHKRRRSKSRRRSRSSLRDRSVDPETQTQILHARRDLEKISRSYDKAIASKRQFTRAIQEASRAEEKRLRKLERKLARMEGIERRLDMLENLECDRVTMINTRLNEISFRSVRSPRSPRRAPAESYSPRYSG